MPSSAFGEGRIICVYPERRLGVVVHPNGCCCVFSWLRGPSPGVGDRMEGDMSSGGWTRLVNVSTGAELRVFRHLYCCDETNALSFTSTC